ncbi:hypothetical protein B7494_g1058 [Chlorociboria aeruginascens]|nr:hypothetical protein B7494_g1058 [Chlorociboria aeruginascens]
MGFRSKCRSSSYSQDPDSGNSALKPELQQNLHMSPEVATPKSEVESESDSSTVFYDHEPFETFSARGLELCQTVPAPSNSQISIERMHEGGFNRIIGVSITTNESLAVSQYILRIPRFEVAQLNRDLAPLQLLHMLRAILEHKRELAIAEGPNQSFRVSFFNSFIITASEMSALGVWDENYYCLCHLDLEPRNILASPPAPTQPQAITGILDWDRAIFGPSLMSCSPPMWLWAWNDEDDEDERLANDNPATPELRELKQLFEHAAGPTYRRFAYGAQYRLALKLMRFAIDGLQSNEDLTSAELLLAEWVEVQRSLKLAKSRSTLD